MSNLFASLIFRKRNQRKNERLLQIHTPNGIEQNNFITINGIEQWVSIRGENRDNPILFFVHGGPASSYSIFSPLLRYWEKHFTIVQWDQPGAGMTFSRNGVERTGKLSFERLATDGIKVVEYVLEELRQDRLILVGSSAGSLTGVMMAKRRPDLFHVYVGTDQNSPDPNHIGYQAIIEALTKAGDKKGLELVEKMGADPANWNQKDLEKRHQHVIKAIKNVPNMIMDLVLPAMLASPMHSFRDILDYFKGMSFSSHALFNELIHFDGHQLEKDFELPVFIFQGDSDIITPTETARAYFEALKAPHKEFALIRRAGHLACFARPEQFLEELITRVLPYVKQKQGIKKAQ
ncbi:alpha/beta hydrolase [Shimazuella sp. AN120528]|uniref:alpha/beta fold hydrolase n=1 Tax=Shimazuella soli TaxID=1892854 RepID=UPI001F0D6BE9|nr:alpha/beta hydrolase [Shimazuella soli]MCH5584095.1 alpha/beta hydrolase [Shimazuella soli]